MPTLEVSSGDVDCTHGATVADIDENEAFYLQSRGISRREVRPPPPLNGLLSVSLTG